MPAQERLRPNDLNHSNKARPEPGHQHEKNAITVVERKSGGCPAQSDIELMPKNQIFGFEPAARLEKIAK
jgi:hypothetical protein